MTKKEKFTQNVERAMALQAETRSGLQEVEIKGYNSKLYQIDLDTIFDDPKSGIFTMPGMMGFLQREEIKFELIEWHGPGGGWPIIRFTGTKESLAELCDAYYDDKGLMEFIEEIK